MQAIDINLISMEFKLKEEAEIEKIKMDINLISMEFKYCHFFSF